jgi:hypothetical protein
MAALSGVPVTTRAPVTLPGAPHIRSCPNAARASSAARGRRPRHRRALAHPNRADELDCFRAGIRGYRCCNEPVMLDTGPLVYALINAVQALAVARVAVLESRG